MKFTREQWDKFWEGVNAPLNLKESKNILLGEMLSFAVEMRLLEWRALPEYSRPKPDDLVPCSECDGTGLDQYAKKAKTKLKCSLCEGTCYIKRRERLSQIIAAKGDVIMFGGRGCSQGFNALSEAIALLVLYQPAEVKFNGMQFSRNEIPL